MEQFKKIFEGNNSAYGQLILTGETTDKGKAVGKAFIKREAIPDQLWQDHLETVLLRYRCKILEYLGLMLRSHS